MHIAGSSYLPLWNLSTIFAIYKNTNNGYFFIFLSVKSCSLAAILYRQQTLLNVTSKHGLYCPIPVPLVDKIKLTEICSLQWC